MNFAVAIPFLPLAMGGMSFASSLLGSGAARRQAAARNRARKQNWEHQLRVRKQNWYQNLSIWGAQRNKYFTDLNENDLAAQRGYAQAQVIMNRDFAAAAQKNEGELIKYLQSTGKLAAAGRTGRSIKRIADLDFGALQRSSGRTYYKLTQSRATYKEQVEDIRRKQLGNRNQLFANVQFAPVPDLAPPAPRLEPESLGLGDYLKAGFAGATSYFGAGGKLFGKGLPSIFPMQGGGGTGGGSSILGDEKYLNLLSKPWRKNAYANINPIDDLNIADQLAWSSAATFNSDVAYNHAWAGSMNAYRPHLDLDAFRSRWIRSE